MTVIIDGTNGVQSVGGSATITSFTAIGDTNTGIFFPAADTIAFAEGGTEAMRIDASGNVGIGTSSPTAKLHVNNTAGTTGLRIDAADNPIFAARYAASADGPVAFFAKSRNATVGSQTVVQNGDQLGVLLARGSDGTNFVDGASITFAVDGTPGTNDMPGRIVFGTSPDGSSSIQERMRLDSSGNLGIGTTSPQARFVVSKAGAEGLEFFPGDSSNLSRILAYSRSGATRNDFQLDGTTLQFLTGGTERARITAAGAFLWGATTLATVSGGNSDAKGIDYADGMRLFSSRGNTASREHIVFYNPNGDVGSIDTSASATAYNTSSDARLKKNIVDSQDAGSDVDALKVRQFDWKVDDLHVKYGFVAQELYAVAPEAVTPGDDGEEIEKTWGVDYSKLVPMLVKEIQSLRARVAQLEAK